MDDLWDTAFGRAIAIKAALVVVLLALGALNRRRTLPRLQRAAAEGASPGGAGVLLRRTLRAEVALGVAALAVTGALAGYPPATASAAGPFSAPPTSAPRAPSSPSSRRAPAPTRSTSTSSTAPTGASTTPRRRSASRPRCPSAASSRSGSRPRKAGPGHYVVGAAALAPPGDWRLELVARISDFDELRTTFTVPIE